MFPGSDSDGEFISGYASEDFEVGEVVMYVNRYADKFPKTNTNHCGVVTSLNKRYVFVRFFGGEYTTNEGIVELRFSSTSQAVIPGDRLVKLIPAIKPLVLDKVRKIIMN